MIEASKAANGGRFPVRGDRFNAPGYADSWAAIDEALRHGRVVACEAWLAHMRRIAAAGGRASLASLNPDYRPARKGRRTVAGILDQVALFVASHGGRFPHQKSAPDAALGGDNWNAICRALARGAIADGPQWRHFLHQVDVLGVAPSLASFIYVFENDVRHMLAVRAVPGPLPAAPRATPRQARASRAQQVSFARLIEPLASIRMGRQPVALTELAERYVDGAWNQHGDVLSMAHKKWK